VRAAAAFRNHAFGSPQRCPRRPRVRADEFERPITIQPYQTLLRRSDRAPLLPLSSPVGLVLSIACESSEPDAVDVRFDYIAYDT
jgi:hypothetical protein